MASRRFDISEVGKATEYLGISINEAANRAVLSLAHRIVARILTVIIPQEPRQPVDRGAYRAAWRAKKTTDGAEVRNDLPQAAIIEWGARAENIKIGRLMIKALSEWVLRKGLVGRGKGAAGKAKAAVEATAMAWAIANAMKKHGIFNKGKGLRILERASIGIEGQFTEELATEIKREFR